MNNALFARRSLRTALHALLIACSNAPQEHQSEQRPQIPADSIPGSSVGQSFPKGECGAGDGPLGVSIDSIGPLALRLPLDSLLARCSRTTLTAYEGFESTRPGVQFTFDSLTATGLQTQSQIAGSRPATRWVITGCGGRLPKGISTCATWAEVVDAYGSKGQGNTEFGPARIRLESLEGIELELDVTDDDVGSLEVQPDLSRVPRTARIAKVFVSPRGR